MTSLHVFIGTVSWNTTFDFWKESIPQPFLILLNNTNETYWKNTFWDFHTELLQVLFTSYIPATVIFSSTTRLSSWNSFWGHFSKSHSTRVAAYMATEETGSTVLRCGAVGKNPPDNAGDVSSISGSGRFPCRRKWQPTPVLLPGRSHGQRSLVGYSPWVAKSQTRLSDRACTHSKAIICQAVHCLHFMLANYIDVPLSWTEFI